MGTEGKGIKREILTSYQCSLLYTFRVTPLMFPLTDNIAQENEKQGVPISQITEFLSST